MELKKFEKMVYEQAVEDTLKYLNEKHGFRQFIRNFKKRPTETVGKYVLRDYRRQKKNILDEIRNDRRKIIRNRQAGAMDDSTSIPNVYKKHNRGRIMGPKMPDPSEIGTSALGFGVGVPALFGPAIYAGHKSKKRYDEAERIRKMKEEERSKLKNRIKNSFKSHLTGRLYESKKLSKWIVGPAGPIAFAATIGETKRGLGKYNRKNAEKIERERRKKRLLANRIKRLLRMKNRNNN